MRLDGGEHDLQHIAAGLKGVLEQVRSATGDFEAMTARALEICEETAAQRELVEVRDLLRWLVGGGFVFLGYRRYRVAKERCCRTLEVDFDSPNPALGLLRDFSRSRYARPVDLKALKPDHQKMLFEGSALIMGKTHTMSQVHRRGLMDDVTIRRTASDGRVVGFDRFVGLFTSKAYSEEAQHIPVLRAKLREVIEAEHAAPGSHNYKELVSAFNSFPKEELFRAPVSELRDELHLILDHKDEAAVRVSAHYDPVRNNVVALVVLPRETFSAEVRKQFQEALGRILDGQLIYYYLAMGEGYRARMHFCYDAAPPRPRSYARWRPRSRNSRARGRTGCARNWSSASANVADRRLRNDGPAPSACITRPAPRSLARRAISSASKLCSKQPELQRRVGAPGRRWRGGAGQRATDV